MATVKEIKYMMTEMRKLRIGKIKEQGFIDLQTEFKDVYRAEANKPTILSPAALKLHKQITKDSTQEQVDDILTQAFKLNDFELTVIVCAIKQRLPEVHVNKYLVEAKKWRAIAKRLNVLVRSPDVTEFKGTKK